MQKQGPFTVMEHNVDVTRALSFLTGGGIFTADGFLGKYKLRILFPLTIDYQHKLLSKM